MNQQIIINNTKMKLFAKIDENIMILQEDLNHESSDIVTEMNEHIKIYMDLLEQVKNAEIILDLVNIIQDEWMFGYKSETRNIAEFLLNETYN